MVQRSGVLATGVVTAASKITGHGDSYPVLVFGLVKEFIIDIVGKKHDSLMSTLQRFHVLHGARGGGDYCRGCDMTLDVANGVRGVEYSAVRPRRSHHALNPDGCGGGSAEPRIWFPHTQDSLRPAHLV
jgi:hypothetical protein